MGDMGEHFREADAFFKKRRKAHLDAFDPEGWTKHSEHHYSRTLQGERLDYWPSRQKFRWKGKTHTGDVMGFIRNRDETL